MFQLGNTCSQPLTPAPPLSPLTWPHTQPLPSLPLLDWEAGRLGSRGWGPGESLSKQDMSVTDTDGPGVPGRADRGSSGRPTEAGIPALSARSEGGTGLAALQ